MYRKGIQITSNTNMANVMPQIFNASLRRLLAEPSPFDQAICAADAISGKLIKLACDPEAPNLYAVEMVMDRVDGRPAQKVSVEQALQVLIGLDDASLAEALGVPISVLHQQRRLANGKEIDIDAKST